MKKRIAVCDFDGTLILSDSLWRMFKMEKLYLNPVFLFYGALIALTKQVCFRNKFKFHLLKHLAKLDKSTYQRLIESIKNDINTETIEFVISKDYDEIYIASASEVSVIRDVIRDLLPLNGIIANDCNHMERPFRSCVLSEKLRRVRAALPHLDGCILELFTDSNDDLPLMDISDTVYMVKNRNIMEWTK